MEQVLDIKPCVQYVESQGILCETQYGLINSVRSIFVCKTDHELLLTVDNICRWCFGQVDVGILDLCR